MSDSRHHQAKNASESRSAVFATLRAFLRAQGTGAPARRSDRASRSDSSRGSKAPAFVSSAPRRRALRLASAALIAVSAALLLAAPAFASSPFRIEEQPFREEVFPTRTILVASVIDENVVPFEWHAEYATSETLLDEGKGTPAGAGTGTVTVNNPAERVSLGHQAGQQNEFGIVHHLEPLTTYYARFFAKTDTAEEAAMVFKFTTLAVAKPELPFAEPGASNPRGSGVLREAHASSPTSAYAFARIESNGAETHYEFAYSESESGPWTPFTAAAEGTLTVAEDFADPEATATGLTPETRYFARVKATNEKGTAEQILPFDTPTAKPRVSEPQIRNVTADSAHLASAVAPDGSETHWRFQSATSESGPWIDAPGASGTITQAQAEATPYQTSLPVEAQLTGLAPATAYYVRLFAENECPQVCGEGQNSVGEPISTAIQFVVGSLETAGPPTATTFAVHALDPVGGTLRLLGSVNPHNVPTSAEQTIVIEGAPTAGTFALTFEGQTTEPIPFDADREAVRKALDALSTVAAGNGAVVVTGPAGGPYTVYFAAGALAQKAQPLIACDAAALTGGTAPTCAVATVQPGGEAYDTHYHFEYELQEEGVPPFSNATSISPVDAGSGNTPKFVGADLPALPPGAAYRYRVSATNTSPGNPVVDGEEHTLTVPVPPPVEPEVPCPNQALRTGPSAHLPDCRAYEQITPVDKGGAQEIYSYGGEVGSSAAVEGFLSGADGDHAYLGREEVKWGSGPTAGQSPYFFSRAPSGWQLTAATSQPEAGILSYAGQVFSPDLTRFGFAADWGTSPVSGSPQVEFRTGPPGGPYATVATVPRAQVGIRGGWVAASADFSTLILASADRKLTEPHSKTTSGNDLYEYFQGALRQANVEPSGATVRSIGSCGATMVRGEEGEVPRKDSSLNAVSADGSRLFFYAYPSGPCPSPSEEETGSIGSGAHLYMREAGAQSLDIGPYRFVEADPAGDTLLIEKESQLFRYHTETHATEPVPAGETLTHDRYSFSGRGAAGGDNPYELPVPELDGFRHEESLDKGLFGTAADLPQQIVRYDRAQHLIQCLSCASPFDPEPRLLSIFGGEKVGNNQPIASANGDYVFFDTPAALLPSDVDGEIHPEGCLSCVPKPEHTSNDYSLSSDVYQWRRDGFDGCAALQGCLSLITSGRGGYLDILLGQAHEGRDVFFTTHESLLPRDDDTASDIYDARSGGGSPEPAPPVECEGDACSHPLPAPNDPTPSSEQFHGAGNEHPKSPGKHKKHHHKKHHHKKAHKRAGHNQGSHK